MDSVAAVVKNFVYSYNPDGLLKVWWNIRDIWECITIYVGCNASSGRVWNVSLITKKFKTCDCDVLFI